MRVKYKKGKYVRETRDGWERYTIITPKNCIKMPYMSENVRGFIPIALFMFSPFIVMGIIIVIDIVMGIDLF